MSDIQYQINLDVSVTDEDGNDVNYEIEQDGEDVYIRLGEIEPKFRADQVIVQDQDGNNLDCSVEDDGQDSLLVKVAVPKNNASEGYAHAYFVGIWSDADIPGTKDAYLHGYHGECVSNPKNATIYSFYDPKYKPNSMYKIVSIDELINCYNKYHRIIDKIESLKEELI